MENKRLILLKNKIVEYDLKVSDKARLLRISVGCDARVKIIKPKNYPLKQAENFLRKKAAWILNNIAYFNSISENFRIKGSPDEYSKNKDEAYRLISKKVEQINSHYNLPFRKISIKNQKTRWASCSWKGNLYFNYRLIHLPDNLIDYLAAHELCHIKHLNHSEDFWKLLEHSIPDCRERNRQLRKIILY